MALFIASVEIPARPSAWPSRSEAAAHCAAPRTSLPAGPASLSGGMHLPRSAIAAARDHGSPRPATACCRSTTAMPENGPSACHQPERGTSPGRAEGRQIQARARGRRASFIAFVHRTSRGRASAKATIRVLADGDPHVNAPLVSAMGCLPRPRSLTPPHHRSQTRGTVLREGAALPRLSDSRSLADAGKGLADDSYFVEAGGSRGSGCGRRFLVDR